MAHPQDLLIAAVDVGGRANIGWSTSDGDGDTGNMTIDELVAQLGSGLEDGRSVALGVEAPLYLPIAETEEAINSQRAGEGNRSWSASSGSSVATLGIHQLAYILRKLKDVNAECPTPRFGRPDVGDELSFTVWEAFVSGDAKGDDHEQDARIAINHLVNRLNDAEWQSDLRPSGTVVNIAAAATLATWPEADPSLMTSACAVVKA